MGLKNDKTYIAVTNGGGISLRCNIEGLTVDVTSKMTSEQKIFHNEMMHSEAYREIIKLFAQQGVNLRAHEKWSHAVKEGANAGDIVLD
jgi:hypothetical protein